MHRGKVRDTRNHSVLGTLNLFIHGSKWWEGRAEVTPGHTARLDLSLGDAWKKTTPEAIFDIGAEYLRWAQAEEQRLRTEIATAVAAGKYDWIGQWPWQEVSIPEVQDYIADLRVTAIVLFETGQANWTFRSPTVLPACVVDQFLPASRELGEKVGFRGILDGE